MDTGSITVKRAMAKEKMKGRPRCRDLHEPHATGCSLWEDGG